jgi:uncharacterized membrane protein
MRSVRHLGAIAAGFVVSIVAVSRLPAATVDVLGAPSGMVIAFLLPTAAAGVYAILVRLWARDPVRDRSQVVDATFDAIAFRVVLFMVALHVSIIGGLTNPRLAQLLPRIVGALLGGVLIAVGNLLPRLTPNLVIGLRPWHGSSRTAWLRMQRITGYTAVGLGAVIVLSAALLPTGAVMRNVVSAAGLGAACVLLACSRKVTNA